VRWICYFITPCKSNRNCFLSEVWPGGEGGSLHQAWKIKCQHLNCHRFLHLQKGHLQHRVCRCTKRVQACVSSHSSSLSKKANRLLKGHQSPTRLPVPLKVRCVRWSKDLSSHWLRLCGNTSVSSRWPKWRKSSPSPGPVCQKCTRFYQSGLFQCKA